MIAFIGLIFIIDHTESNEDAVSATGYLQNRPLPFSYTDDIYTRHYGILGKHSLFFKMSNVQYLLRIGVDNIDQTPLHSQPECCEVIPETTQMVISTLQIIISYTF